MHQDVEKKSSRPKIGALLVKMGFVKPEDVKQALDIQRQYEAWARLPLGLFLMEKGLVSEHDLEKLWSHGPAQGEIRSVLQEEDGEDAGPGFSATGTAETVSSYLARQHPFRKKQLVRAIMGKVREGSLVRWLLGLRLLKEGEIDAALAERRRRRPLGRILYDMNLVTLSELHQTFIRNYQTPRLGEILEELEVIDARMLQEVLEEQDDRGTPLGRLLVSKSAITVDQLYFALSVQENLPFHRLDGFLYSEKQRIALREIMGQRYAEENRILPLLLNGRNLTVAVSRPYHARAVKSLQEENPHLRVSSVLITEDKFEQLFVLLYGELLPEGEGAFQPLGQETADPEPFTITDPVREEILVDLLYEQFDALGGTPAALQGRDASGVFKNFIHDKFQEITGKYQCHRVSFSVEELEGGVRVLAFPILERAVNDGGGGIEGVQ